MNHPIIEYGQAIICEMGHVISADADNHVLSSVKYCPQCGSSCISKCPSCGAIIRGNPYHLVTGSICSSTDIWNSGATHEAQQRLMRLKVNSKFRIPAYCYNCGNPYPWTEQLLEECSGIVDLIGELNDEQKKQLKECFPALICETPQTARMSIIASKLIKISSTLAQNALQNILADRLSQFVLHMLGWLS